MTPELQAALERIAVCHCSSCSEAFYFLKSALEDYEKVKRTLTYQTNELANTKAELSHAKEVAEGAGYRLANAKAQLEKQRPLIEAVMGARLIWVAHPPASSYMPPIEVREFDQVGDKAILRAALTYKETK
ncbi:MAG: hypothetical protein IMZ62_16000 [Chloroflexi bacterium]|nr:hypothetical protein [Chloroflexota bacterium]